MLALSLPAVRVTAAEGPAGAPADAAGGNGPAAARPAEATPDPARLARMLREQDLRIGQLQSELESLRAESRRGDDRPLLDREIDAYLERAEGLAARGDAASGRRVRLGGYFSLEFRDDGEDTHGAFDQHRLVIELEAEVAEAIRFSTEIEFEGGGAGAEFLTDNEILVEQAELAFELVRDALILDVGIILMPWGRFNSYHDDPLNDLTDRPIVSRYIGAVAFGQAGVAVEGSLEPAADWFLDYKLALTQGLADGITTESGVRGGRQSFREDNNDNKAVWLRVVLDVPVDFLDLLEVGGSGNYGRYDDSGDLAHYGYALELFARHGPLELVAEYMNQGFERGAGAPPEDPRRMDGWYVQAAWHVFPASWRGRHALFTQESTFTFVLRVEGLDLNHATRGSTFRDDLTQVSLGFDFRPVERSVFKLSYTWVDSEVAGFESGSADRFTLSWASYF